MIIIKGKIITIKRLNNSNYGSPRYQMIIFTGDKAITLKTASNAPINYQIYSAWRIGAIVSLDCRKTKTGNILAENGKLLNCNIDIL